MGRDPKVGHQVFIVREFQCEKVVERTWRDALGVISGSQDALGCLKVGHRMLSGT